MTAVLPEVPEAVCSAAIVLVQVCFPCCRCSRWVAPREMHLASCSLSTSAYGDYQQWAAGECIGVVITHSTLLASQLMAAHSIDLYGRSKLTGKETCKRVVHGSLHCAAHAASNTMLAALTQHTHVPCCGLQVGARAGSVSIQEG